MRHGRLFSMHPTSRALFSKPGILAVLGRQKARAKRLALACWENYMPFMCMFIFMFL